jgi:hypothetical protein
MIHHMQICPMVLEIVNIADELGNLLGALNGGCETCKSCKKFVKAPLISLTYQLLISASKRQVDYS